MINKHEMKYNWIKSNKNERCVTVAMIEIIEKRTLILSVKIQVYKKKKQILDNKTNKRKIYIYISLNNNKSTINLHGKLEFFLVPTTGRHIDVETLD